MTADPTITEAERVLLYARYTAEARRRRIAGDDAREKGDNTAAFEAYTEAAKAYENAGKTSSCGVNKQHCERWAREMVAAAEAVL